MLWLKAIPRGRFACLHEPLRPIKAFDPVSHKTAASSMQFNDRRRIDRHEKAGTLCAPRLFRQIPGEQPAGIL